MSSDDDEVVAQLLRAAAAIRRWRWTPGAASAATPADARERFELEYVPQSMQFMIDLVPFIHRILERDHARTDVVEMIDIGAGSGSGSSLLAQLHVSMMLHARARVQAIDILATREAWVRTQYPLLDYRIMQAADLPERGFDLAVCSHVIEHQRDPQPLIHDVLRSCRGHAIFYAPYREAPLSPGHVVSIDESTFATIAQPKELHIVDSVAWAGPGRRCIVAVVDCRLSI
jgi:2-polyprenyl-3-methyl-5-hydroxy-6-metoxy-1,4-benzoquinol methylase